MIAGGDARHALADRDHHARAFMAEDAGEDAFCVQPVQRVGIGMADAAGDQAHQHLARLRRHQVQLLNHQWLLRRPGNGGTGFNKIHDVSPLKFGKRIVHLPPHPPPATRMTRHTLAEAQALYDLPFMELLYQAQTVHRAHHDPQQIQISTLLSIKTGACPEDCKYCPQSARYHTGVNREALLKIDEILAAAERARVQGATRFCMGAAWRDPKKKTCRIWWKWCSGSRRWGWRPA